MACDLPSHESSSQASQLQEEWANIFSNGNENKYAKQGKEEREIQSLCETSIIIYTVHTTTN